MCRVTPKDWGIPEITSPQGRSQRLVNSRSPPECGSWSKTQFIFCFQNQPGIMVKKEEKSDLGIPYSERPPFTTPQSAEGFIGRAGEQLIKQKR